MEEMAYVLALIIRCKGKIDFDSNEATSLFDGNTLNFTYLSKKDGKNCYFATKQIDRAMADKPNFQKYFKNELLILKSLKHPNIVHLEDVKSDNKYYYIVMEYINGGSLTDCLKTYQKRNKGKSFPEEIVQHLMKQIVSAVKHIHYQKIIHRDLKPDNIMVNFNNEYDKNNCNMLNSFKHIYL